MVGEKLLSSSSCWGPADEGVGQHREESQENCLVCGGKLDYFETGKKFKCIDCEKEELGYVYCTNGHYICDDCHGEKSFNIILDLIASAEGTNPLLIGEKMITESSIPMLGCEHAWVVAGALMAAIKNHGKIHITEEQIIEALNRTIKQAIGAYCGLTGVCGIAPAIGAVYSVILGAACPKNEETAATMHVVSKVIEAIANETGPCCCKNFVHTALKVACDYSERYLHIQLPSNHDIVCQYTDRHPHGCRQEQCSYYARKEEEQEIKEVSLDDLVAHSLKLGAEKANIIDANSIAVGHWVQWKCQYGCPLYNRDACHPPEAPSVDEMKKLLTDYTKALLINGGDGKMLSKIAVELEYEAVKAGFYKAFAFIALPGDTGATWGVATTVAQEESQSSSGKARVRPMMEACGIDVYQTARANGFEIDTKKETYGRWNYYGLVLLM